VQTKTFKLRSQSDDQKSVKLYTVSRYHGIWRNLYGQRNQIKLTLRAQTSPTPFFALSTNRQIFDRQEKNAKRFSNKISPLSFLTKNCEIVSKIFLAVQRYIFF